MHGDETFDILSQPIMNDPRYETVKTAAADVKPGELIRRNAIRGRVLTAPTRIGDYVRFTVRTETGRIVLNVPFQAQVELIRHRPFQTRTGGRFQLVDEAS